MKMETNKVKILTLKQTSLPGKSQRLEVGFGMFRIIFAMPKLRQKELALNSTGGNFAAEVKLHTSLHTSFY